MKSLTFILCLITIFGSFAAESKRATYRITLTSNWSEMDHLGLPNSAHFSPLVIVTHNSEYNLVPLGTKASPGLELVAELGRTNTIEQEIQMARTEGKVQSLKITENQFVLRQLTQTVEVTVSKSHPYLSFVSMIAPSPDWVIGLQNLKLYNTATGFTEGISPRGLYAIDAGTEQGDFGGNFSINNRANTVNDGIGFLSGVGFHAPFAIVEVELIN